MGAYGPKQNLQKKSIARTYFKEIFILKGDLLN